MWWKIRGLIFKCFCIKEQDYSVRKVVENSWSYFLYFCIKMQGYSLRNVVENSWSYF